jgi:hypothetical protein
MDVRDSLFSILSPEFSLAHIYAATMIAAMVEDEAAIEQLKVKTAMNAGENGKKHLKFARIC